MVWRITFDGWRIFPALLHFWYGSKGLLPEVFVFRAGWGGFWAGVLGLLLAGMVSPSTRLGLTWYRVFHFFSLVDLILAVVTGSWYALVLEHPAMVNIVDWPLVLIPLFGVPITGVLSVTALVRNFKQAVR